MRSKKHEYNFLKSDRFGFLRLSIIIFSSSVHILQQKDTVQSIIIITSEIKKLARAFPPYLRRRKTTVGQKSE